MVCVFCNVNSLKIVCLNCFSNTNLMISLSDANYDYKLGKKVILKYDPTFVHYPDSTIGAKAKYFISEIEQIAFDVVKNLDDKDPKKKAYIKQKCYNDLHKEKIKKLNDYKKKVKNIIIELIVKYDIKNEKIDDMIDNLINIKCKDYNIDCFGMASIILDEIIENHNSNYNIMEPIVIH